MAVHRNRKALLDVAEISEFWDEAAGEAFSNTGASIGFTIGD